MSFEVPTSMTQAHYYEMAERFYDPEYCDVCIDIASPLKWLYNQERAFGKMNVLQ